MPVMMVAEPARCRSETRPTPLRNGDSARAGCRARVRIARPARAVPCGRLFPSDRIRSAPRSRSRFRLCFCIAALSAGSVTPADLHVHAFGRGAQCGLADGLGLEEIPGVGRLDVEADALGLRAFAERFREGKKQRHHRNQQRDFLVAAMRGMLGMLGVFEIFVRPGHASSSPSDDGTMRRTHDAPQGALRRVT